MNLAHILTVYFKELRDALRDRRTLISTLVVPTLGVPLVMGIVAFISAQAVNKTKADVPAVMIVGAAQSPEVRAALGQRSDLRVVEFSDDWARRIADKQLRAAVELPDDFDARIQSGDTAVVRIRHYEGELASGFAVQALQRFFNDYRQGIVSGRLRDRGVSPSVIAPFSLETVNVAPPEKVGGNMLGGLLPYLALIACFAGAMHPAIDLTAGEKERGTLETILSSPIERVNLVLGKFLLVLTSALTTVVCSLTSMTISLIAATHFFGPGGSHPGAPEGAPSAAAVAATLHLGGVVGCLGLILPIAVLASAILLAIAISAKTMKEAQSYLAPLLFLVIVPAMISVLPGIELSPAMALVPVLNVSLTTKQMVSGIFNWTQIGLTFVSCWVYAALALAYCVRRFNQESVLFRT